MTNLEVIKVQLKIRTRAESLLSQIALPSKTTFMLEST